MKLTEAEMRMVFQIESTNQNAALNEIYMTWRYAPNPATKETAEGLLDKLRPLSDQECMDLIRKVQAEYRLPEKARTIGEMLAEARQQSGAQKLSGHDIMALERFDPATRHMIVFDVLTHDSPVGWKGEKMRLFLTDTGYSKALENQEKGHIKIRNHAKVSTAMSNGELPFVSSSAVYENPYRLHIIVTSNAETDLSKLKAFDTIGGALEIEYDANHISAVEEILTE